MKTNLQIIFENNLALTKRLYGGKQVMTALLMTRCDKEAIMRQAMNENGTIPNRLVSTKAIN